MLKRQDTTMLKRRDWVLKRHRSTVVESLPHDVVELILERLPVKSLLRYKSVSKKWKSTIESPRFKQRQLIRRRQSRGPDVLFVRLSYYGDDGQDIEARRFVFGSSVARTAKFSVSCSSACHGSCDGLVCLHCAYVPSVVVNPATGWQRTFPLSRVQQLYTDMCHRSKELNCPSPKLGFGKDKIRGTFKPVWLYNSSDYGLDNVTTCEVFDFSTNAWRFVVPASPCRINDFHKPVYLDGSLYWFTGCEEEETKVLSFDLHTETFQVVSKAPFPHVPNLHQVTMCILDNRLCVSEMKWPTQVIWSFDSKTWKKLCSIDLTKTFDWFGEPKFPLLPIAILGNDKLLLQGRDSMEARVIHDLRTKSYDLLFRTTRPVVSVYYYESLLSVPS